MAIKTKPRLRVPSSAKKGEIIEIKTLIAHDMESGFRKDKKTGKNIPRDIINTFTASFNGKQFFVAHWYPAISANPYEAFYFRASTSGEFLFTWKDDDGSVQTAKASITVA
jgi:sulfur-oxidizing protein SoxZ